MNISLAPNHAATIYKSALFTLFAILRSAPELYSQDREPPAKSAQHQTNVNVAMRDGVLLRADILLPSAEGKFPALVYRTPYGKHFALKEFKTFEKAVGRGYAVI